MSDMITIFWPGDARAKPNELAPPHAREATAQLERALTSSAASPTWSTASSPSPRGDRQARRRSTTRWSASSSTGPTPRTPSTASSARTTRCCSPRTSRGLAGPGRPAQHRRLPRERRPPLSRGLDRRARLDRRRPRSWSGSTSGARPARSPTTSDELAYARRRSPGRGRASARGAWPTAIRQAARRSP